MQQLNAADDEGRDEEEEEERRQIIPAFIKLSIVRDPPLFALEVYFPSTVIPHFTTFMCRPLPLLLRLLSPNSRHPALSSRLRWQQYG